MISQTRWQEVLQVLQHEPAGIVRGKAQGQSLLLARFSRTRV
ncbi:MAG TPA: hypothetical protein PKM43_21820 [Verrucomicrobiota bacterium]|nr:hypothetical protein [Verrucomicrobiota bacterium]